MTVKRMPDPCSDHPHSLLVRTTVRDVGMGQNSHPHLADRLTQHRCTEPSCGQGLGWLYEDHHFHTEHGPGVCDRREITDHIRATEMQPVTLAIVFGIILNGGLLMDVCLGFALEYDWNPPSATAVALIGLAIAPALGWTPRYHQRAKAAIRRMLAAP